MPAASASSHAFIMALSQRAACASPGKRPRRGTTIVIRWLGEDTHVGAYAACASLDETAEAALYAGIAAMDVAGLEQPFFGELHRRDEGWLISQIRPDWTIVLTTLPGTMARLNDDKHFGLASADPGGRKYALDFMESARLAVEKLHRALSRRAVRAVLVHSAPRLGGSGAKSSLADFADSLTDLRGRDWQGARLPRRALRRRHALPGTR